MKLYFHMEKVILLLNIISIILLVFSSSTITALTIHSKPIFKPTFSFINPSTFTKTTKTHAIIDSILYHTASKSCAIYDDFKSKEIDHLESSFLEQKSKLKNRTNKILRKEDETSTRNDKNKINQAKIPIRFINYRGIGSEKLVYAEPGSNILSVSDEYGVNIPRQCRSGLCGTCTSDIQDPTWNTGERVGYQTIRACQAAATLPKGCRELVIDCYRMIDDSLQKVKDTASIQTEKNNNNTKKVADLMKNYKRSKNLPKNFEDGWEDEFQVTYKPMDGGNNIEVIKKKIPDYRVRGGEKNVIDMESDRVIYDIGMNVPPWENIYT